MRAHRLRAEPGEPDGGGASGAVGTTRRSCFPSSASTSRPIAPEVGRVTSLTAPHRIADALLRDSLLDGQLFRLSDIGKSFTDASARNATALFKVCPTGLVFGLWDSTGPKGGLGAKFQRALVSEIVGINAVAGSKTASRIDPLNILKKAADIYKAADEKRAMDDDTSKAKKKENGEPVKFGKREGRKPSAVQPRQHRARASIRSRGGVTIDEARHTVVLSLASLRRLGFTDWSGGSPHSAGCARVARRIRRGEPRTRSALPLPARAEEGLRAEARSGRPRWKHDSRGSRPRWGHRALQGGSRQRFLMASSSTSLPGEALAELQPSPKLADLVKKSRELAVAEADVGDA